MATPDHTLLASLSGLPAYLFAHLRAPPKLTDTNEQAHASHVIDCIEQVKLATTCLLGDSDAFREVSTQRQPLRPQQWPLSPMVYASLLVGLHLLDQYAERLMLCEDG
ncbi:hypothetical protein [Dyella acidiphila]|uniref:Uncharacterized protein n=1 Tax=Dyella acidiphila TaxID=2775866 RepID=A0ABR9G8Y4_9GAMM|nr:hypothetical protein [Dyella acidiphila]MBE1160513.1 hypothetical protein [Dyella acidiphila]